MTTERYVKQGWREGGAAEYTQGRLRVSLLCRSRRSSFRIGIGYPSTGTGAARVGAPVTPLAPTLNDGQQTDITATQYVSNAKRGSLLPAGATTTYSVITGSLPPGVTLNTSTGVVSGTPTQAGSYAAVIELTATRNGVTQASSQHGAVNFLVGS